MVIANLSFKLPIDLTKIHGFICGMTGSGKSVLLETIAAYHLAHGWKVVDISNPLGRMEGCFISLPPVGNFKKFWDSVFNKTNENFIVNNCDPLLKETYESGFKTRIFIPYTRKVPDQIPQNCSLYTLGLSNISVSDFSILFGRTFFGPRRALMLEALNQINQSSDLIDLKFLTDKILRRGYTYYRNVKFSLADKRTRPTIDRVLVQLLGSGMVSSKKFNYSLNLKKELKDKKRVTVFTQNFIEDPVLQFFNVFHLLNRIYNLLDQKKVKQKVLVIIRELSLLAPRETDDFYQRRTSNLISKIVKISRGAKLSLWADSQSPLEVNKEVIRQMYHRIFFRLWSPEETEYVMVGSSAYLEKESRKTIQRLDTGECIIVGNRPILGKALPPCWFHFEPGSDFFQSWKQAGRKFKDITAVKEHIEDNIDQGVERFKFEVSKAVEEKKAETRKEHGPSKKELIMSEFDKLGKSGMFTLDKIETDRLTKKYGVKRSYLLNLKSEWNKKHS